MPGAGRSGTSCLPGAKGLPDLQGQVITRRRHLTITASQAQNACAQVPAMQPCVGQQGKAHVLRRPRQYPSLTLCVHDLLQGNASALALQGGCQGPSQAPETGRQQAELLKVEDP